MCVGRDMNEARAVHVVPNLAKCVVDGFKHGTPSTNTYILTHFHSDHYTGLTAKWDCGTIYTTPITAALVTRIIEVDSSRVKAFPIGEKFEIPGGAMVTFLDAHHCPGAAIVLFECPDGKRHLHCGDMRYSPLMKSYPALLEAPVDRCYLDTTYAHPKHIFPPQAESVKQIVDLVRKRIESYPGDETATWPGRRACSSLILLSAYTIGKEKVLLALAKATGLPIYCDDKKMVVLSCLDLSYEDMACFTNDPHATPLHTVPMGTYSEMWPYFKWNFEAMPKYAIERGLVKDAEKKKKEAYYESYMGIIPTGWAAWGNWNLQHQCVIDREDGVSAMHLVPYLYI